MESLEAYDFKMRYFNSDGKEASMCGNGGRCIVAFAFHLGIIKTNAHFMAVDGIHHATLNNVHAKELDISLEMQDVNQIKYNSPSYFLNTGSPHHIEFVESLAEMDVYNRGKKIRHSEVYRNIGGANVNFIEIEEEYLKIRTFERGVEDETYACGTGATAAAIAYAHHFHKLNTEIKLQTLGGVLRVSFEENHGHFSNIILSGPATKVYSGSIEIEK